MTLRTLSIAADGGSALLRRIDNLSARLAKAGSTLSNPNDLDITVEGEGFLRVILPDGSFGFTRAESLTKNADGLLATLDGRVVDPPVQVPPFITKLTVDPDGFVQGIDPQSPDAPTPIGQIELSRFENPAALESVDGMFFRATEAAGDRVDGRPGEGLGEIRPQAPINPMRELMDLIALQRAFELNNRIIQAADDVLQGINTLRRKP